MSGEQSNIFNRSELAAFGRVILIVLLYAISGFLCIFALGAAMSEPGVPTPTSESLIQQALVLFAGASVCAWSAGLLWIGLVFDGIWPTPKGAPAIAFIILAVLLATPVILVHTIGETKTLSDLQLVTWAFSPPCLIAALLRALRGRQGASGSIVKRALLTVVSALVVAILGYCAFIVAANMGIDTSFRRPP